MKWRKWTDNFTLEGDRGTKVALVVLGACFLSAIVIAVYLGSQRHTTKIIIDWNSPRFIGERSGYYNAIFGQMDIDEPVDKDVLEEFEKEKEDFAIARSNAELIKEYGISFKDGTLSDLAIACNTELFDMCNKYFLVSYNGEQVSPIIPMAIANNETPSRADNSITYSSLFPSKLVQVNSPDAIQNMSCIAVLESAENFSKLANDHWTRDRGALQMNPNYGINHEAYNSLMGPSEASILANIDTTGIDFTGYQAYEPRNGRYITAEDWIAGASTGPGDRFSVRDSVLRIASEAQDAVYQFTSMYEVTNDSQLAVLIAMQHNAGSTWNPSLQQKKIGNWRSGYMAYRFLVGITSEDFLGVMNNYVSDKLKSARDSGKSPQMYLERDEAIELFNTGVEMGILSNYESYVYTGNYYYVTYTYPIQALYSYLMLGMVYSGK